MDVNTIITGAIGIILMIFIPGYCLTLALFPKREFDFVEMSGISIILGFTTVFVLYALNKNLSVPINTMTTYLVLILLSVIGLGVWYVRKGKIESTEPKLN
jgi:uncharacterized membrane protein